MQRSFASLTAPEALQIAISIEQRNAELYHRYAEMFTEFGDEESLEVASVFWEMAVEERGHRALLEQKYRQVYGELASPLEEHHLHELIEVPRLDLINVFSSTGEVSARDRALQVALQAEISAQQYYEELVKQTPEGPLLRLYLELANIEDTHVAFLESKLSAESTDQPSVQ